MPTQAVGAYGPSSPEATQGNARDYWKGFSPIGVGKRRKRLWVEVARRLIPASLRVPGRLYMTLPQSILVLDDDPNFCRILEAKLTKASFEVSAATDAASAFRYLLAKRFVLILLDLRMPDANGLELLSRLRSVAPATPVLIMTAYETEGLREQAVRAGAVDVLYKPFDLNVLTTIVQRIIEGSPPEDRVASLMGETLSIGRAVVIQLLSGTDPKPHAATVMEEKVETFAVTTTNPLATDPGAPVLVSITGSDALYEFRSKVVSQSDAATMSLAKPAVIHRHQRRKHLRRPFQRLVELRLSGLSRETYTETSDRQERAEDSVAGASTTKTEETVNGISIDLSVGGMCVALPTALNPGSSVSISFTASDDNPRPFRSDATVIRSHPVNGATRAPAYRVGLAFTDVPAPYKSLLRTLTDG